MSERRWLRPVDRFGYRVDQILKTTAVLALGVAAFVYCLKLTGFAPKVVGVIALTGSVVLARIAWRGLGRFYELDKNE